MKHPILEVNQREVIGKQVRGLRNEGLVPAVVYGNGFTSQPLALDRKEFTKLYREVGGNTVIELKQAEAKTNLNVLIHDVQYDVVRRDVIHVDFYKVNMAEKITTNIPIHFVGEAPAVQDMDGMLITNRDEIEVECLPGDLISEIEVDISSLVDFETTIHVSDLKVPDTIRIITELEEALVTVEPPRSEEELAELEEEVVAPEMPEAEQGSAEGEEEEVVEEGK